MPLISLVSNRIVNYSNSNYIYTFSNIIFKLIPIVIEELIKNITISTFNNT